MPQNRLLSVYLDFLRFAASVEVVFGHARLQVFGPSETGHLSLGLRLVRLSGQYAHAAVVVFFVISGYLVGGKLFGAGKPGFVPKYLLDRSTRIYIVALPALTLGFLVMVLQQAAYGHAYQLTSSNCAVGFDIYLKSLLFLHQGVMRTPCFNGPYWSLAYEVFYYLFFLAVAVALLAENRRQRMVAAGAALVLGAYGLLEPGPLWALSTLWLMGLAIAQREPFRGWGLLLTLAILALFLFQSFLRIHQGPARQELVIGIVMLGSIVLLQRWQPFQPAPWLAKPCLWGAGMSYSLYLFHAPVMNLLRGILEHSFGITLGQPMSSGASLVWYPVFILTALAFGTLFWWLFERRTGDVRSVLAARLGIPFGQTHQPIPPNQGDQPLPARQASQDEAGSIEAR